MDMKEWLKKAAASGKCRALPVLSFPSTGLMGANVRQIVTDSDLQAKGMQMIAERCNTPAVMPVMDLSVEAECFGAQVVFSDDTVPYASGIVVSSQEDADKLPEPHIGDGRTGVYIDAVKKAADSVKDVPVFAGMAGPLSVACCLTGASELLFSCIEEPEMVHKVLEKTTAFLVEYAKAYKEAGAKGLFIAEAAAGLMTADLCLEFSSEYVKRITDAVQDEDFPVIYHNCGGTVKGMVPEILASGAAAYHFGNAVSMDEMMKLMPEDVLVMGNIDPVEVLKNGTPEIVREETLRVLKDCGKYSNFIISSGCDIPSDTPWENINAFFCAVSDYYN